MFGQCMMVGTAAGDKWVGPWRIRVNTEADEAGNLTAKNHLMTKDGTPILTDWGDGTSTISDNKTEYITHTYAKAGEYIISHYALNSFEYTAVFRDYITADDDGTEYKKYMNQQIIEVIDPLPQMTDYRRYTRSCAFMEDRHLKKIPANLFVNNTDITDLSNTFLNTDLQEIPKGLFDKLTNLTRICGVFEKYDNKYSVALDIPEHLFDNCPITECDSTFRGAYLTNIPNGLFSGKPIKSAINTFGEAIITGSIGDGIFSNCTSLTDIGYYTSPYGPFYKTKCKSIGDNTFSGCTSLKAAPSDLFNFNSDGLTSLGSGTFKGCTSLTTVKCFKKMSYDSSLPAITLGDGTFEGCTALKSAVSVFAYSNISNTGANLFKGCTALTDVSRLFYGSGLKRIDADIFDGCTSLTTLDQAFAVNEDVANTDNVSQEIVLTVADNMALSMKNFITTYFKMLRKNVKNLIVIKFNTATGATLSIDNSNEVIGVGSLRFNAAAISSDNTYSLSKDGVLYKGFSKGKLDVSDGYGCVMVCKNTAKRANGKYCIEFY